MWRRNFFNRQSFSSPALVGRWTIAGDESGIRLKLQTSPAPGWETRMMQGETCSLGRQAVEGHARLLGWSSTLWRARLQGENIKKTVKLLVRTVLWKTRMM